MKKFISFFLMIALVFSLFPAILTIESIAIDATYTVEQWEMLEIPITSSKEYTNPYINATIDATFTHTDGTTITIPGFIKDGKKSWAVRFTPTKTGLWTYSTTCSDKANTGLFTSGTINATKSSGKTALSTHGFIKSSDNGRYFTYDDGTPFFWLGDTQWQSPNFLKTSECNYPGCTCSNQAKHEIDNRKAKGFTVFQTYFSSGAKTGLWTTVGTVPSYTDFNERIDKIFDYVYASDMVAVIGFGLHSSTPNSISQANLNRFVRYIVARYACYSVVWMSGQEITETSDSMTSNKTCMDVFMSASATASRLDGYKHPSGAHMYPMYSTDERAVTLDNAAWHNVWILQKGHGGTIGSKYFYKSYYYNTSGTVKPIIEGEANYEDINCGGFTGYDAARMCGWKALTNGCAGFTYGASGVWIDAYSLTDSRCYGATTSYSYDLWYTGINKPGSYEMTYLRRFFENLSDWTELVPRYSDRTYADFLNCAEKNLTSTEDARTVVCYFYNQDKTTGCVKKLDNSLLYDVFWYNPLTGKYIQIESDINFPYGTYNVPNKPSNGDWALLITANNLENTYIEETPFTDLGTGAVSGNKVTPVSVSANGGVYTEKDGTKVDMTSALFDNNASTVWTPLNQMTSQTFFYDLGSVQNLSNIVITPNTNTVLPKLRVYGSNDNENWTILVDNAFRDNNIDSSGNVSEKLSGGFRYLRIVLLSNTYIISPAESEDIGCKTFYNEKTKTTHSFTEIADMAIYSTGATSPTTDKEVTPVTTPKATVIPASSPLPTTAPKNYRTIENLDCESGTTDNWGVFSGGSIRNVSDGANGSAHAIKFMPSASEFSSVGYDLGPYLISDKENGYNGYGPGQYKASFWIKSAKGDTGKINVLINSEKHLDSSSVRALGEEYENYKTGTFFGTKKEFTIDSTWQKVEFTFTVTEEYHNLIQQIYNDDNLGNTSVASTSYSDIYTLWLRLDASGTERAYKDGVFSYLIDELSIECISPIQSRKGIAVQKKNISSNFLMTSTDGGYLDNVAVENGTISKSITVYNTSEKDLNIDIGLQANTVNEKDVTVWSGPKSAQSQSKTVKPGESVTFDLSITVTDGMVEIPNCESRALSKFFLRFNLGGDVENKSIIFVDNDILGLDLMKFSSEVSTASFVYSLPGDGTKLGDCGQDESVTSADRILLSRFIAGWNSALYIDYSVSDINRDGQINSLDRIILSRYLAGWEDYGKYFED